MKPFFEFLKERVGALKKDEIKKLFLYMAEFSPKVIQKKDR